MISKKYRIATKMELVFPGSIFYNIGTLNILGVECHADFG
jgi:hypothetical protein